MVVDKRPWQFGAAEKALKEAGITERVKSFRREQLPGRDPTWSIVLEDGRELELAIVPKEATNA